MVVTSYVGSFVSFVLILLPQATAQVVLNTQVLSTLIYTLYGDRTPFRLPTAPTLTPLGAQQLYAAGTNFRQRYVEPMDTSTDQEITTIQNISPYQLFHEQMTILSTDDQYVVASAQAFMQGLYPPLETASNYTYIEGQSTLANGSNTVAPLNGFQYPNIVTASSSDLNSIYLEGTNNCPAYAESASEYYNSPAFQSLEQSTQSFYASLQPGLLDGIFSNASVGYFDAYYIWDYLNFGYIHNTTVANALSDEDLTTARILADDCVFALLANTSASGSTPGDHIGTIAGRTLASRVLEAFYTTINTQGQDDKMTLLFGGFEPMVSFAALAGLTSPQNAAFYNIPAPGSSFVFELCTLAVNASDSYPDINELFVRFLYQNGTDADSTLVPYPLFGQSPSEIMMSLSDFIAGMEDFMIFNIEDWCQTCNSYSIFCPAFTNSGGSYGSSSGSSKHQTITPAIAGVIGAIVTLVVAGLLFAVFVLLAGFRVHRVQNKRRSELGGFKGAEKLRSDQDLTIPKNGTSTVITEPDPAVGRGHERVGSWELRDQAKAQEAQRPTINSTTFNGRRPSYEEDDINVNPFAAPVKPHSHV